MLNTYPLWKNLAVLLVVVMGVLYALPNIYPPDYALQISVDDSEAQVTVLLGLFALRAPDQKIEHQHKGHDDEDVETEWNATAAASFGCLCSGYQKVNHGSP